VIREFEFYHGVVFTRILHGRKDGSSIRLFRSESNSSYVIDSNIGLYIKYSAKRLTPWRFTFAKDHQSEIEDLRGSLSRVFVLLVCSDDGIVCLAYDELKEILDAEHGRVEWISVNRRRREMYSVKGSDGSLEFKIGQNDFPGKLFGNVGVPAGEGELGSRLNI
jgi:hypothetical protein